jgi:cyclophilin family peptidyl-prolyl cis-trans isomerase
MFKKILLLINILFIFNTILISEEISKDDISKLSNQKYFIRQFFFYAPNIDKSFLVTKNKSGTFSVYYFTIDGEWIPVSNAPKFKSRPSAKEQFDNISFDPILSKISFGNFIDNSSNVKIPSIKQNFIDKTPKNTTILMKTNKGDITLKLYNDIAPKTVENFLFLSKNKKYNGLIFHRVIKNFMIQGGDPTGTGKGGQSKWGGKFKDEFNKNINFNKPYLLAMANSGPNTNESQFFITVVQTPWLNQIHTIFGEVTEGFDIVNTISKVKVNKIGKPLEDIEILDMQIQK